MKPYYEDAAAGITIYHADCLNVLPQLGSAEAVITDPPYNVGIQYGHLTDDRRYDYGAWCREWFGECRRVAEVVAIAPGFPNVGLWAEIAWPSWVLAWMKPGAMGRSPVGFCNWEPVYLWGVPKKRDGVDTFTAPIIPTKELDSHPCPKPLMWGKRLVSLLSEVGDVIVDPFMGSGTTLRAAKDLSRRAIGIEIEERYCEIAAKRLAQEVLFAEGVA